MPGLRNALMVGLAIAGTTAVEQQIVPEVPLFSISEQAVLSIGQQAIDAFDTGLAAVGADDHKVHILHSEGQGIERKTTAEVSSVGDIERKTLEAGAIVLALIGGAGYKAGWRASVRRQKPKSE